MKKKKVFKNKLFWRMFLPAVFLFLVSLAAAFISLFKKGHFIMCGDLYYPLKPGLELPRIPFVWDTRFAAGITAEGRNIPSFLFFLFFYLLERLSISPNISQAAMLFTIFTLTPLAMYYLVLVIAQDQRGKIRPKDCLTAFIAGLFYNFNLWNLFNLAPPSVPLQLSYLATPLILAFFIKGMKKNDFLYIFFIAVTYVLISPAATNPILILNTLWPVFFFGFFVLAKQIFARRWQDCRRILIFAFKAVAILFLVNFWWLLPMLSDVGTSVNAVKESGRLGGWFLWKSAISSFLNIFKFTNNLAWTLTTPGSLIIPAAHDYVSNSFLVVMGFIFPVLAFSGLLKKKKNFYVLFFSATAVMMIFLAKGLHRPFTWVNQLLHQKVLLLALYRSIEWYTPVVVLSYGYLFSEGAILFFDFIKKYKSWLAKVFIAVLIAAIFIFNYPFWTGKVVHQGQRTGEISFPCFIKIPPWYFAAADWVNSQGDDFKILSGPGIASYYCADWGFAGAELGVLLFNKSILNNIFGWEGIREISSVVNGYLNTLTPAENKIFPLGEALSLANVKYIALRHDLIDCSGKYPKGIEVNSISEQLKIKEDLSLEKTIGKIDFFKNNIFLPHFYIPKEVIYYSGGIKMLRDIISFEDYQTRSGVYVSELNEATTPKINKLKNQIDKVFTEGELMNTAGGGEMEIAAEAEKIELPYISHKPEGIVYLLILENEKFQKWRLRDDEKKLFEERLFYAGKRAGEYIRYGQDPRGQLEALMLERYRGEMTEAFDILVKIKSADGKNFIKYWAKYKAALLKHQTAAKEMRDYKDLKAEFRKLETKIDGLVDKGDFSKLVYRTKIPVEGLYDILVNEGRGWTSTERIYFEEGFQEITLPIEEITSNLADDKLRIHNYSPNSLFRVKFSYKTNGDEKGRVSVSEDKAGILFGKELPATGGEEKDFEMFFESSAKGETGKIRISASEDVNLDVRKLNRPKMMARLRRNTEYSILNIENKSTAMPKITFVKVNPTKYKIKVEGAKKPYNLIFLESFNEKWKIYLAKRDNYQLPITNYQPKGIEDYIFEILGKLGAKITSVFIKNKGYGEEVASYFDGEIKEGTHRMTFLEPAAFETWGRKPVAEDGHFLVNGYANSWYITPEDVGGKESYELIVEFSSQKLFYVSLFISLAAFAGCCGYLVVKKVKKTKKRSSEIDY